MAPDPNSVRAGLRQNKRKLTRPREVVFEVITRAHRHLTPAEIFQRARTRYPSLGLTTVYRTLGLLEDLGYVQRIHLEQGCHSYAASARRHGHPLVCTVCGRSEEFIDGRLERLIQSLRAKTGYSIDVHMIELLGRCPSCQGRLGRKKSPARVNPPSKS